MEYTCKIPKLFEIMHERGITSKKLSDDTSISTGNISDWKSGRSKPSSQKLSVLAKYFDVSIDYLLGNSDALNISPTIQSSNIVNGNNGDNSPLVVRNNEKLDEMQEELLKMFNDLEFKDKLDILNYIE